MLNCLYGLGERTGLSTLSENWDCNDIILEEGLNCRVSKGSVAIFYTTGVALSVKTF